MTVDVRPELVPGDQRAEVGATLSDPVPQSLGLLDQLGLWGNLGVSLLGFTGALFVLQPGGDGTPLLPLAAALVAIVVGTVLGTFAIAVAGIPGTRTGAPSMMLLRGLFGARVSALPTVLNILQCLGWGTFELVTIAAAGHEVAPALPRPLLVVAAGAVTTLLTIYPLGSIRVLRRYVTAAVVVVLVYLLVQLLREPLPAFNAGSWSGFWVATDSVVAVAVSFVPLAADYTRHSRSSKATFGGVMIGYGVMQVFCYVLGLLALVTVARSDGDIYGAFIAVPVGAVCFAVLAVRELDQSFANVYSTAVSIQNLDLRGLKDRRVLALGLGVVTTVLGLTFNVGNYQDFLLLLGSVFVPLFGVLAVDFFLLSGGRWDLSTSSPSRIVMLVPWVLGFVVYQLINPGYLSWWSGWWGDVDGRLHFTPASWMSASVVSFVVAALLTLLVTARRPRRA